MSVTASLSLISNQTAVCFVKYNYRTKNISCVAGTQTRDKSLRIIQSLVARGNRNTECYRSNEDLATIKIDTIKIRLTKIENNPHSYITHIKKKTSFDAKARSCSFTRQKLPA